MCTAGSSLYFLCPALFMNKHIKIISAFLIFVRVMALRLFSACIQIYFYSYTFTVASVKSWEERNFGQEASLEQLKQLRNYLLAHPSSWLVLPFLLLSPSLLILEHATHSSILGQHHLYSPRVITSSCRAINITCVLKLLSSAKTFLPSFILLFLLIIDETSKSPPPNEALCSISVHDPGAKLKTASQVGVAFHAKEEFQSLSNMSAHSLGGENLMLCCSFLQFNQGLPYCGEDVTLSCRFRSFRQTYFRSPSSYFFSGLFKYHGHQDSKSLLWYKSPLKQWHLSWSNFQCCESLHVSKGQKLHQPARLRSVRV